MFLFITLPSFAQLRVIGIQTQADTLVFNISGEAAELYKGQKGYILKDTSYPQNDASISLYLGETKEKSVESLRVLIDLCKNDVGTTFTFEDAQGVMYYGITASELRTIRTQNYHESNGIMITNSNMNRAPLFKRISLQHIITYYFDKL